jgi:hypothetical protein
VRLDKGKVVAKGAPAEVLEQVAAEE